MEDETATAQGGRLTDDERRAIQQAWEGLIRLCDDYGHPGDYYRPGGWAYEQVKDLVDLSSVERRGQPSA